LPDPKNIENRASPITKGEECFLGFITLQGQNERAPSTFCLRAAANGALNELGKLNNLAKKIELFHIKMDLFSLDLMHAIFTNAIT
jgi:hypothetical protein